MSLAIADDAAPPVQDTRIVVDDLYKTYETPLGPKHVLKGVSFSLGKGERIAVLGRNGAGKSTLVRLIGGVEKPTMGSINLGMSLSWPIALMGGGFDATMSGYDNIRFLARLYELDIGHVVRIVDDFAELGSYLYQPVKHYSGGMRGRFAFGLSLAVDFDCLLIDEATAAGDRKFAKKCEHELWEKRRDCAMILVTHNADFIRSQCSKALVLKNGYGIVLEDLELAINIYYSL